MWEWVNSNIWSWMCLHETFSACLIASFIIALGWIWARRTIVSMTRARELEIILNLGHYWDRGLGMETWARISEIEKNGLKATGFGGWVATRGFRPVSPSALMYYPNKALVLFNGSVCFWLT